MKKAAQLMVFFLLLGAAVFPAQAAFTSFYVFGDALSAASNNAPVGPYYYGDRWCNGRVWVEVLAQRQGLPFYFSNSISYFGNTSTNLVNEVNRFKPPGDAGNALVVIWVNNADLYYPAVAAPPTLAAFNAAINQSQINHYKAITNLYAKGIRTLIMPNVVDISSIPAFNTYKAYTNLFHQASVNYNAAFNATVNQIQTNPQYADLTIYVPDFFALLTNLMAYPADYGVINALESGLSIDAFGALGSPSLTKGPATNYIFWDSRDPTAMVHAWMANLAQQLISPVQISGLTAFNGSNRLDIANVPIGQNGFVLGCTNVGPENYWLDSSNWTTDGSFSSISATQSVFVLTANKSQNLHFSPDGPFPGTNITVADLHGWQLYRLSFPYVWTWP
jgi:phospholipase/lecithinase/hemolysin